MEKVFTNLYNSLEDSGRLVVVFAHKDPTAWETLVSSLIKSGFQTTAAWPVRTESANKVSSGMRAFLSTSVWLVLKKRDPMADYAFDRDIYCSIEHNINDSCAGFGMLVFADQTFYGLLLGQDLKCLVNMM